VLEKVYNTDKNRSREIQKQVRPS